MYGPFLLLHFRLHRGEQKNVSDGLIAGQEHDQTVDADAAAACGRHTVLEGTNEVLVHEFRFVVAGLAQFDLMLEAFDLVERVVQLGIGVGELGAADEELKTLGEVGLRGFPLREDRDLDGVVDDEGRLLEVLLDERVVERDENLAPGVFALLDFDVFLLRDFEGFLSVAGKLFKVDAGVLLDGFRHGQALEGFGEVHLHSLVGELRGPICRQRGISEDGLGAVHHAVVVGVCLIEFDGGEFRVVLRVHAFVAEDTADLIDPLHAADDESLQRQLGGDAHVHVDVERIVVGDERTGSRAAGDGVEDRSLDFDVTRVIHRLADAGDDLGTLDERVLDVRVDDEVDVALTVPGVRVLQAVELFRQGQQALGKEFGCGSVDGDLAGLGLEDLTGDFEDVADVPRLLEGLVVVDAEVVTGDVDLDVALAVLDLGEGGLAHDAAGDHAAADGDFLVLECVVIVLDFHALRRLLGGHDLEGVVARLLHGMELIDADLAQTVGVAFNNFEKITKKSEAQMLCSVLVASVQDELLYAKNIKAGTVPEYFSSSRDMGESCKIVAATYSGSDSADAYSGASTNGELCVYSDYSASGESADTDSVKYYPLVAHASYAPQNRVGVNTHSDYLTS